MYGPKTQPTGRTYSKWIKTNIQALQKDPGFAFEEAILAFGEKLAEHQIQMPPEFTELVSKHFWDLV